MSKESDELYRSLFLFFLLLVLLGLVSCEPKVQIVEKEIIKEIMITDTVYVDSIVEKEVFITKEIIKEVPVEVIKEVIVEKDAVNEEGSIKAQSVDLVKIIPYLVGAIKELTARVEALEN